MMGLCLIGSGDFQTDRMNIEAKNVSTFFFILVFWSVRFVVVAIICEVFFYIL